MRLSVYPAARADMDSAQDWYDQAQPGLGEEFTDELVQAFELLARQPHVGSRRYAHLLEGGNLRFWALDRFPFLVFYQVQDDALAVLRVLHERRDIQSAWGSH